MKFQKIMSPVMCAFIALTNVGTGFSTCFAMDPASASVIDLPEFAVVSTKLFTLCQVSLLTDDDTLQVMKFCPSGANYADLSAVCRENLRLAVNDLYRAFLGQNLNSAEVEPVLLLLARGWSNPHVDKAVDFFCWITARTLRGKGITLSGDYA